jgi:hypothetical protein
MKLHERQLRDIYVDLLVEAAKKTSESGHR